jgi:class 3 adenylate cyclase/pimeloyl-ACP methyl ester carboxylesterase
MQRRLAAILAADVVGYSHLMGLDEVGTLRGLGAHRKELIEPSIADHHGRVVKLMGDGTLVEFASVVDAVNSAVAIQRGMVERNANVPESQRIVLRIGIHLGDVIVQDDDIYGDGVNVAARLEGLADAGGICISRQVLDQIEGKLDLPVRDLGAQRAKNLARPIGVFAIQLEAGGVDAPTEDASARQQEIRFCTAHDGVQIAYATAGDGPPLIKAANWLNHLDYDWESPIWRHLLQDLAASYQLVRYDARGNGLSDWEVEDISFEAFVRDLEAVVEAVGLARFPLFGISQGCAVSIAYAARHPERVSRMVLYGGYSRGRARRGSQAEREQSAALITLMRQGWGAANPAFRHIFTSLFVPGGTPEQLEWFDEVQRVTTSPENAARIRAALDEIDISELLPKVTVPTLVVHCRGDAMAPFEEGRRMAAMIPGARFVALEGDNHLILDGDPCWPRFRQEIHDFLSREQASAR